MTYPKCGIAKSVLEGGQRACAASDTVTCSVSVLGGDDLLANLQKIPFHITVQAHNRQKLMSNAHPI